MDPESWASYLAHGIPGIDTPAAPDNGKEATSAAPEKKSATNVDNEKESSGSSKKTSSSQKDPPANRRPLDDVEGLKKSTFSIPERVAIAASVGEEVVTEEELTALFTAKDHPIVYDGFEPSGRMHIAQGVLRAINVNKLTSTGCLFKFWVADWFAQLNNKMGGDLQKIKTVGLYMIEIWKAIGMDMTNVSFSLSRC